MSYATYNEYISLYEDGINTSEFNRLLWDASELMNDQTTGVDGICKLRLFPPTDLHDAEAVKRCACELVSVLYRIEETEKVSSGVVIREDGTVGGKKISSVSSGSESITYAANGSASTIDAAVVDLVARKKLLCGITKKHLTGAKDANGVNLLYAGVYPRVC